METTQTLVATLPTVHIPQISLPDHTQLPESDGTFVKNFQEHPQSISNRFYNNSTPMATTNKLHLFKQRQGALHFINAPYKIGDHT